MTNENNSNSNDDTWTEFVNAHSDDLSSIGKTRSAKKFEKNAAKVEKAKKKEAQRKLHIENFNDDIFTDRNSVTRGYSTSWFDADEADNHFHAPNPSWNSVRKSGIVAALLIVLGFACIFAALFFTQWSVILGSLSGILLILGFVVFVTAYRSRPGSGSMHGDGSRV
ncbi:DUF308 domain-containing protein [Alloscardovia criceti]|uniref:DUF308 domain-containing protein n=1 Tax=Alloscardovia criceti TaxID=356828 RepID=UPI000368B69C|nr:DUF308 domain-containing protein [Alloscardovia criceti]